eukprot:TRINITY_DN46634_c0_g1_i1.p1 TRINITY_DN46634_c0_g1~~TRINITY_DN46634_c0_g1_i1.p1  ORF type:complete len:390 (+),score=51.39 TRINITY_DN46634_c0_g1_i1:126-1295(+)
MPVAEIHGTFGGQPEGCSGSPRRRWADIGLTEDVDAYNLLLEPHRRVLRPRARIGLCIEGILASTRPDESDPTESVPDLELPGAATAVLRLVTLFGAENVCLFARARPGGAAQLKTERWLHEICRCCERMGVLRCNIIFCGSTFGPNGKGAAADRLGLSHFVDQSFQGLSSVFSDSAGNISRRAEEQGGVLVHFASGSSSNRDFTAVDSDEVPIAMRRFYRSVESWDGFFRALEDAGIGAPHSDESGSDHGAWPDVAGVAAAGSSASGPYVPRSGSSVKERARGKRRGTRGGAKNRRAGLKGERQVDGGGGDGYLEQPRQTTSAATTTASPASGPDLAPVHPAPVVLPAGSFQGSERPRLQLKPRSTNLGDVGGMASVSEKTRHLFGRS